ncbi:tectonic-3-like isoform X3 [Girardinichthys multiradiatus]|uniref:tectonic-3-like isoform X3 n=1 Tax=Girardinichthys multiradiatus TaxID=208333 RepID=UPI001FAC5827|nr:tectonic-3-like isoform X3 [Girardinichthys multiradiatus]
MISSCLRLLHVLLVLCGRLALSATDLGATSSPNSSPTYGVPFSSPTPAPGVTGVTEEDTLYPSLVTKQQSVSETPAAVTEAPSPTTMVSAQGCLCDLTPGFCDIGCCCDTTDCNDTNLARVFTGCPKQDVRGVCIEKWLMFRANMDSTLVTVTDTLFCIQAEDDALWSPPGLTQFPALRDSYRFSPQGHLITKHSRDFYRADDVIQTFFSNSFVRGLLRQPSPGAAFAFCFSRNPAKFLRSTSLSCTRMVTSQSCTADPNLRASSYFSDMSLIKVPTGDTVIPSDYLIPVIPQSDWPVPVKQNGFCINVVKEVEFIVGYTARGELMYGKININLADVALEQLLLQKHSVQFQLATPGPTPGEPALPVGLREGSAVIGRFNGEHHPLTSLGVSEGGACSSDPRTRSPVLFTHNTITGCTFSSPTPNCTELRLRIYEILQGSAAPDVIAMNSGSQPDWTRVITQECTINPQELCESGCNLPLSLFIQILWARQGFMELPQNHILGAKFLFHCQIVQCPLSSPLALTAKAAFIETTVYPEPPRGVPQLHWRFPFGFFSRGAVELDGHVVPSGSSAERVSWSWMMFPLLLLAGLGFFTVQLDR